MELFQVLEQLVNICCSVVKVLLLSLSNLLLLQIKDCCLDPVLDDATQLQVITSCHDALDHSELAIFILGQ